MAKETVKIVYPFVYKFCFRIRNLQMQGKGVGIFLRHIILGYKKSKVSVMEYL